MRVVACGIIAMAACYQPAADDACAIRCGANEACPADRQCVAGFCVRGGDTCGSPDGPLPPGDGISHVDAPTECAFPVFTSYEDVLTGSDYTRADTGLFAYYGTEPAIHVSVGSTFECADCTHPRLAAAGDALFSRGVQGQLQVQTFDGGNVWTNPTILNTNLPTSALPGTVSATALRHMVVSFVDESALIEGTDQGDNAWAFGGAFTLGMSAIGSANLTSDALHLVFVGRRTIMEMPAIYHASRTSPAIAWNAPEMLLNVATATEPFATADCRLFYTDTAAGKIREAKP